MHIQIPLFHFPEAAANLLNRIYNAPQKIPGIVSCQQQNQYCRKQYKHCPVPIFQRQIPCFNVAFQIPDRILQFQWRLDASIFLTGKIYLPLIQRGKNQVPAAVSNLGDTQLIFPLKVIPVIFLNSVRRIRRLIENHHFYFLGTVSGYIRRKGKNKNQKVLFPSHIQITGRNRIVRAKADRIAFFQCFLVPVHLPDFIHRTIDIIFYVSSPSILHIKPYGYDIFYRLQCQVPRLLQLLLIFITSAEVCCIHLRRIG